MTETEPGESGDNYRVESGGVHRGSRVGSAAVESEMTNPGPVGGAKAEIEDSSTCCCACTCKDIKDILPSCIILIVGLAIMVLVIPYAFSSVIKQIQMENALRNITNVTKMDDSTES